MTRSLTILLIGGLIACAYALANEDDLNKLSGRADELRSELRKLAEKNEKLSGESASLSAEIDELRSRGKIRQLRQKLADAQSLSTKIENLHREMDRLRLQLTEIQVELHSRYSKLAVETLEALNRTKDREKALELARRLARYRSNLTALEREMPHIPAQKPVPLDPDRITVDENDSPSDIEEKADLLKDEADKMLNYSRHIEELMRRMRMEIEIRSELARLTDEMDLFDDGVLPREIMYSSVASADSSSEPETAITEDKQQTLLGTKRGSSEVIDAEPPSSEPTTGGISFSKDSSTKDSVKTSILINIGSGKSIGEMSIKELNEELSLLRTEQKRVQEQLKRLNIKASSLYEKAREIKTRGKSGSDM